MSSSTSYRLREGLGRGSLYLILLLGASIMILPFLWMVSTSVMTLGEANSGRLLPRAARVYCPHVNLPKPDKWGTVTDFVVSPKVRDGEQELQTDSYYVAVSRNPETTGAPSGVEQEWRFQLVDNKAKPVAIVPLDQPQGALTEDWQLIPAAGGEVDTGRGL